MSTDPIDDDTRAERLADEAVEFVLKHHPSESTKFRKGIARLYIKTRLDPSARTAANTAILLGIPDRRRLPEIEANALAKLRRHLREQCPDLFAEH